MHATRVQAALLAGLLVVCATSVPATSPTLGDEAAISAVTASDGGDALRASADAPIALVAPTPRRIAIAEAHAASGPAREISPAPVPRVDRRTHRRRVPRMTVDSPADH